MIDEEQITVCFFGTYDKNYSSNRIVIDGLRQNDIRVIEVNAFVPLSRMDKQEDISVWQIVKRFLVKGKIFFEIIKNISAIRESDIIYVGYPGHLDVIAAWFVARLFSKKLVFYPVLIVYTFLADESSLMSRASFIAPVVKWGERMIYHRCDLVFADTELQKEYFIREFGILPDNITVLSFGADDAVYKKVPQEKSGDSSVFRVVYYGRYSPLHGVEHIVESARLSLNDPDIRYIMVGKGLTYEENYKKAKDLGITNMEFYPDMFEKDAIKTLQSADVFLGFLQKSALVDRIIPNKVYQGLALGKAVITADSPVIRTVFTHKKDIFTCEASSGVALYDAIRTLKGDVELRASIANNGYSLYQERFTPNAIGREFRRVVTEKFFDISGEAPLDRTR